MTAIEIKNQKSGVERLFEISTQDDIDKAIIIENNHVYTYGYERYETQQPAGQM